MIKAVQQVAIGLGFGLSVPNTLIYFWLRHDLKHPAIQLWLGLGFGVVLSAVGVVLKLKAKGQGPRAGFGG